MAFKLSHLHIKSPDPQKAAQWYVDNLGAEIVGQHGSEGPRMDLLGLRLNLTTFIERQTRQQSYGIEHIGLHSDDMDSDVGKLKASGARILEELTGSSGQKVCFLEDPHGIQFEIVEATT